MKKHKSILIIGGGITGLVSAYLAMRDGQKVTVLEAKNNFGGLLNTFDVSNSKLEHFYHHFFTHDKEIHWLIEELDLKNKLIYKSTSMGVFRGGKLYNFNGLFDLMKFKPVFLFGKLRFILSTLYLGKFANWEKKESISSLNWFYKNAGRSVTNALWKPLLDIKFGPFSNIIPLSWMIGRLRQRLNSRKNGDEKLGYIDGSLYIVLEKLLLELKNNGVNLVNNSPVDSILSTDSKVTGVIVKNKKYTADKILFTIPSTYFKELIKPINLNYYDKLSKVQYFGAVCVVIEMKKRMSNVYWMNVADDGFPFGGIIEHTNFISEKKYDDTHILYLSRYFSHKELIAKMTDDEIRNLMMPFLFKIYDDFNLDLVKKIHIFKTLTAAPVCDLNFSKKVLDCKTPLKNVFMANMMHIYPDERSVNNSIRLAAESCRVMGINTSFVPYGSSMSAKIGFN